MNYKHILPKLEKAQFILFWVCFFFGLIILPLNDTYQWIPQNILITYIGIPLGSVFLAILLSIIGIRLFTPYLYEKQNRINDLVERKRNSRRD